MCTLSRCRWFSLSMLSSISTTVDIHFIHTRVRAHTHTHTSFFSALWFLIVYGMDIIHYDNDAFISLHLLRDTGSRPAGSSQLLGSGNLEFLPFSHLALSWYLFPMCYLRVLIVSPFQSFNICLIH